MQSGPVDERLLGLEKTVVRNRYIAGGEIPEGASKTVYAGFELDLVGVERYAHGCSPVDWRSMDLRLSG